MKIEACVIIQIAEGWILGGVLLTRNEQGKLEWILDRELAVGTLAKVCGFHHYYYHTLPYLGIVKKPRRMARPDWEVRFTPFRLCDQLFIAYNEESFTRAASRKPTFWDCFKDYFLGINGINRKSIRTQRVSRHY